MTALSSLNLTGSVGMNSLNAVDVPLTANAANISAQSAPDFRSLLKNAATNNDEAALHDSAAKLVSSAFLLPLLQEVRDSTMAAGPFAPGIGEKRFGPMLDQHLADAISSSPKFPLVNAIVDRYKNHAANKNTASQTLGGQKDVVAR